MPCKPDSGPGGRFDVRVEAMGLSTAEGYVLTVARHYFAAFAAPERQSWIAAISAALEGFGPQRGPEAVVAVLAVTQAMQRVRRSVFLFNSADCARCSRFVTGHERLLLSSLRAVATGRSEAALSFATLLCEGNDARPLVSALQGLAQTAFGSGIERPDAVTALRAAASKAAAD
jgi:hypothetical protein